MPVCSQDAEKHSHVIDMLLDAVCDYTAAVQMAGALQARAERAEEKLVKLSMLCTHTSTTMLDVYHVLADAQ